MNLAARMESGAKQWGTYAMCTEATRVACQAHGGDRLVFRALGRVRVKGRSAAVPIYEIGGLTDSIPSTTRECIAAFEEALRHYHAQDWDRAEALFQRSALLEPLVPGKAAGVHSNPSLKYIDLVREMRLRPLAADWDGVYVMKEK